MQNGKKEIFSRLIRGMLAAFGIGNSLSTSSEKKCTMQYRIRISLCWIVDAYFRFFYDPFLSDSPYLAVWWNSERDRKNKTDQKSTKNNDKTERVEPKIYIFVDVCIKCVHAARLYDMHIQMFTIISVLCMYIKWLGLVLGLCWSHDLL